MHAGSERRRWARVCCQEPREAPLLRIATNAASDDVVNAFARDISRGGCSFELDSARDVPEVLAIKVFLPGGEGILDLESRIVWQRPGEKGTCVGVVFPGLSETEQQRLHGYFRHVASAPPPTVRQQAIAEFEQGVLLFHRGQLAEAKRAFQKVIREHAGVIDVARVAGRYHDWCQ